MISVRFDNSCHIKFYERKCYTASPWVIFRTLTEASVRKLCIIGQQMSDSFLLYPEYTNRKYLLYM